MLMNEFCDMEKELVGDMFVANMEEICEYSSLIVNGNVIVSGIDCLVTTTPKGTRKKTINGNLIVSGVDCEVFGVSCTGKIINTGVGNLVRVVKVMPNSVANA